MQSSFEQQVEEFVGHQFRNLDFERAAHMAELELIPLLSEQNPYLVRVKCRESASQVIASLLDGCTSARDANLFAEFLRSLAIYVSEQMYSCTPSRFPGIDIELQRGDIRYLIAVKSENIWEDSQHKKLRDNFHNALEVLRRNKDIGNIQPTLGICYGNFKTTNNGAYLQIGGQSFWELISGRPNLYMDIIEPIGHRANKFNDEFHQKRANALNRMEREFLDLFCKEDGSIDWPKIVTLVSKSPQSNSAEAS